VSNDQLLGGLADTIGRLSDVLDAISKLAREDEDLASCHFFSLLKDVTSDERHVDRVIVPVLQHRPKITAEHMAWLLFAVCQLLTNFAFDTLAGEPSDDDLLRLRSRLGQVMTSRGTQIVTILKSSNMCTNVLERYAGLQIVTHMRYGQHQTRILDLGCSLGLGLMAINTPKLHRANVADPLLMRELNGGIAATLVGLDVTRPTVEWAEACCLPEYRGQREHIRQDFRSLRREGSSFTFIQGDALCLDECELGPEGFDIVWTSNACYEMEGDRAKVEAGIRQILKPDGIWAHAYYRSGQTALSSDNRTDPYVVAVYPQDGWAQAAIEVLESESNSVGLLRRGRDFDRWYRDYT
jgi:SAM-dependent methyltransferase